VSYGPVFSVIEQLGREIAPDMEVRASRYDGGDYLRIDVFDPGTPGLFGVSLLEAKKILRANRTETLRMVEREIRGCVHMLRLRRQGIPYVGAHMRARGDRRRGRQVVMVNRVDKIARLHGRKRPYPWSALEFADP
jgi:hypothetical protein